MLDKLEYFYVAHRAKILTVTMSLLIAKFKQTHREDYGINNDPTKDAIIMAIRRWMKRNRISLRRGTNKAQYNTYDVHVMNDFRGYVIFMIELKIGKSQTLFFR